MIITNSIAKNNLKQLLTDKFQVINYTQAKEDIIPFIKDTQNINLWNSQFFIDITSNLK